MLDMELGEHSLRCTRHDTSDRLSGDTHNSSSAQRLVVPRGVQVTPSSSVTPRPGARWSERLSSGSSFALIIRTLLVTYMSAKRRVPVSLGYLSQLSALPGFLRESDFPAPGGVTAREA
jgi:hypothetical protein